MGDRFDSLRLGAAGVETIAVRVLPPMTTWRVCERTGLSIPECSCRACCEELLRGCEPKPRPQLPSTSSGAAICTAHDYAGRLDISVPQLHELARQAGDPDLSEAAVGWWPAPAF
jgi:hypothetical protein